MRLTTLTAVCGLAAVTLTTPMLAGRAGAAGVPLTLMSSRVTVAGTSNVHDWTASTTAVQVTAVEVDPSEGDVLGAALQPGGMKALTVTIAAASLKSPKDGIDKNMHKALKVQEHPEIRFQLRSFQPAGAEYKGTGLLTIAGIEKEVVLTLHVERKAATLVVTGGTSLLMTDYGIKPPSAMLGMVKAGPKIAITLDLVVAAS